MAAILKESSLESTAWDTPSSRTILSPTILCPVNGPEMGWLTRTVVSIHTVTWTPSTLFTDFIESFLNGRYEAFGDVHSNSLVLKLQLGEVITCQRHKLTNHTAILPGSSTLLLMQVVKPKANPRGNEGWHDICNVCQQRVLLYRLGDCFSKSHFRLSSHTRTVVFRFHALKIDCWNNVMAELDNCLLQHKSPSAVLPFLIWWSTEIYKSCGLLAVHTEIDNVAKQAT